MKLSRRDFIKLSSTVGALAAVSEAVKLEPLKTLVEGKTPTATPAEKWVKSVCRVCSTQDYINVHMVDGVIDKIEGYPDPIRTKGKICPRGSSGHWFVYDPYRAKVPLKRTNPKKGVGIDPKWVEITWDEAYNTIAEKAKAVRAKGNAGTMWFSTYSRLPYSHGALYTAFQGAMRGDCYSVEMGMNWCGHTAHYIHRVAHGAFGPRFDYRFCNYMLLFGSEQGLVFDSNHFAEPLVDAHSRGMKIVYINPVWSAGPNIVDEWIPIIPGTDGACASAMLYVLIHELGIYDVEFVKKWTNGPYLIRADNGYFARDAATKKPQVWDPVDKKAKPFDDATIKDYALEGEYTVEGVKCNPAWQLLKDRVKGFTPEWASPICGVPAGTIRRIAKELGEAAQIGSKIVVDGIERPYRPVSTLLYTNAINHAHGFANAWGAIILGTILGAQEVPGGLSGASMGYLSEAADKEWGTMKDGLIPHPAASYTITRPKYHFEFPPKHSELEEFFPLGDHFGVLSVLTMTFPDDYWGVGKRRVEFGFGHAYSILSMYAVKWLTDLLSTLPFLALSSIFMEEPNEFADIVLPDRCYLEEYRVAAGWLQQPVVEPLYKIPHIYDVFMELCERTGCLYGKGGFNDLVSAGLKDPYKLDLNRKYTTEEIFDRICKNINDKGLDWWKENGGIPTPPAVPLYEPWKTIRKRVPIYVELHKRVADELRANMEKHGVKWEYEDYAPLPTWIPSHLHKDTPPYDLIEVAYLYNVGGFLSTNANPWCVEIAETFDPYALYVWMNEDTAKAKGIADGDLIWVESEFDRRQGWARLSQVIHPKVIAVNRHFGKWAGNSVIEDLNNRHLGFPHQALRPLKLEYIDKVTVALENCIKVRVYKA